MDPLVERMDMVSNYQTISNDNIAKLAESSESGKVKNVLYKGWKGKREKKGNRKKGVLKKERKEIRDVKRRCILNRK